MFKYFAIFTTHTNFTMTLSVYRTIIMISWLFGFPLFMYGQEVNSHKLLRNTNLQDSVKRAATNYLTLEACITYALSNQPALNKTLIGVGIAKANNAISLSSWLPQINISGNLIHYIELGIIPSSNAATPQATNQSRFSNTFIPQLAASQALFSPSLLYAAKSAPLYNKQAELIADSTKINLVAMVSKSFYNVLLTLEQINVLKEDTTRLGKSMRNAYYQYKGGIVDETDFEQATIALNNSKAQLKQVTENIKPRYATLKQLIGYPTEKQFEVSFDTLQMANDIHIDTLQHIQYEKRIEYQQLKNQKELQRQLTNYYKLAFLPTASAFYNYNIGFQNNQFSHLLDEHYPSSLIGISFNIPIFTGMSRLNNLRKAKLQEKLIAWSEVDLKLQIDKEHATALANYKSNLYNFQLLQKNVNLAKRVYFVVDLQYKQGIVAYLNVIAAESNLITAQIGYLNALFQVLSSKIDLQKAIGMM